MTIIIVILAVFVLPNLVAKLLYKVEKLEKTKGYFIENKSKIKSISNLISFLVLAFMLVDVCLLDTIWLVYLLLPFIIISMTLDRFLDLTCKEKVNSLE
ncbi:hypothetical protein [Clostridium chrysemydis]|uniref:hypothetical protein n=1 Tax=Clostridium chrysemydis TaxID=2665504 RepID=UPI00188376DF|nr:hypothetical protein [Clostridium chrysemydis]